MASPREVRLVLQPYGHQCCSPMGISEPEGTQHRHVPWVR